MENHGGRAASSLSTWIPDRGGNVSFRSGLPIPEVIHRHDLTVRALHAAGVSQIAAAAVLAENDLAVPDSPAVAAEPGPDRKGRARWPWVRQRRPSARRIRLAGLPSPKSAAGTVSSYQL